MDDIAPELYKKIKTEFERAMERDKTAASLLKRIRNGNAGYGTAGKYADRVGANLSTVLKNNLTTDTLPGGKLYRNIANRVVEPMLKSDYDLVAEAARITQQSCNRRAKIGLNAVKTEYNKSRATGIINRLSEADTIDDISWILDEPITNFSHSIVDDTLKDNINFQSKAGLHPRIIRTAGAGCCEWCASLAGTYSYPVRDEVYQRHENCGCTIEYDPGENWTSYQSKGVSEGDVQNSWTKQWSTPENQEKIEERKKIGLT